MVTRAGSNEEPTKTGSHRLTSIAESLEGYGTMFGTTRKVLKWMKLAADGASSFLLSGLQFEKISMWMRSKKAVRFYLLVGGGLVLTSLHWKPSKADQDKIETFIDVTLSCAQESKKINDAYQTLKQVGEWLTKPKEHLLPIAFAATIITANYLMK